MSKASGHSLCFSSPTACCHLSHKVCQEWEIILQGQTSLRQWVATGSVPIGNKLTCPDFWVGYMGSGIAVLADASMPLALSAHTPRLQLCVYSVSASWRSELGKDMPSRYLASAGIPV